MGYLSDIHDSSSAAKDVALYNRLNGKYNNHQTILGTFLATNSTSLFCTVAGWFSGDGSDNKDVTGPDAATEQDNFDKSSALVSAFNKAHTAYNANPSVETANALKNAYDKLDENSKTKRTISDGYKLCKGQHPDWFS